MNAFGNIMMAGNKEKEMSIAKRSRLLMLAIAPAAAALLVPTSVKAATDVWTGGANDGLWSSPNNWQAMVAPINGDSFMFGSSVGGTAILTDDVPTTISSLVFSGSVDISGAAGAFTINPSGGVPALTIAGTLGDHSANGNAQTFNLPVSSGGMAFSGAGNSAMIFNSGGTVTGGLVSTTNGATADTLTIGAGATLSFSGATMIGVGAGTSNSTTSLNVTGGAGSTLTLTNSLSIGANNNTGASTSNTENVNLTGVGNFSLSAATGSLNIGTGNQTNATLLLSNGNNAINVATVNVGNFANGTGIYTDLLQLGAGNNTLQANNITIGRGVNGTMKFAGANGQLTIQGMNGGAALANVTVGVSEANTTTQSLTSALNLAGHAATLNLNTLVIGQNDFTNFNGPTNNAAMTFDAGTLTASTIQMSKVSNIHGKTNAMLTIGGGTVTVNTAFDIIDNTTNNANSQISVLNVNGGTVTLNTSIDEIISGTDSSSAANGTIDFNGGTLNMTGHAIGLGGNTVAGNRANVDHVNMPASGQTFTLMNLGKTSAVTGGTTVADGINGAGLVMDGAGTLILDGTNTYGPTTVSSGVLQVGAGSGTATLGTGAVTIHAGGTLRLHGGLVQAVVVPSLTFDGTTGAWSGNLDLTSDKLIISSVVNKGTALANLENQAHSVLMSSTMAGNYAIAVMDNAVLNKTSFGGVAVDLNSILAGAEMAGDTNADGHVDLTDLSTVLNNFGTLTSAWTSGNFDGAATIDLTDLSAVLNNFGLSNPNASDQAAGGGAVAAIGTPEPASLAVLGLGAVALLSRRRKA